MQRLGAQMVQQMNNIDIKIDELFDLVENTNYYKDYVLLKEKVKSNKHIM